MCFAGFAIAIMEGCLGYVWRDVCSAVLCVIKAFFPLRVKEGKRK